MVQLLARVEFRSEQKKETFADKLFHRGHHHDQSTQGSQEGQTAPSQQQQPAEQTGGQPTKKETLGEEVREYLREDEKLESEGKEYGGLM
jgi:hypothetical protein